MSTGRSVRRANIAILICVAAGLCLRLALSAISLGTNDVLIWQHLASEVNERGLLATYRSDPLMNHPPLPVLWATFSLWMTGSQRGMTMLIKLPAILADVGSITLLARIWNARGRSVAAAIAMALSPVAILISAYHCNTDSVYAFMSLLAMCLLASERRFFLAGLVLAGAINIKLIPLLLIPAAFSFCRSWRDAIRLLAGMSLGAIPFIPLLADANIRGNMLGYSPPVSEWGIAMILHRIFLVEQFSHAAHVMMSSYVVAGRWIIVAVTILLSIYSWKTRCWSPYELGTLTYAVFLVLAPGFGPQYTVIVVPLLLAVSITRGWLYGIFAGTFLAMSYVSRLVSHEIPLRTLYPPDSPTPPGSGFGFVAWIILLWTIVELAWPKRTDVNASLSR